MRLYQYWDTGSPPAEVAGWIEGFRAMNPDMKHHLHDHDSASWFIGKHCGARQKAAFECLAVPAMQADYFRLCALFARGGLWIDADFEPLRPLSELLACAPQAMMLEWDGFFGTGLMLFRRPHDPFVGAFLELATANIEARILPSALHATGPVLADALRGVLDPAWFATFLAQGEDLLVASRRKLVNKIRPRVQVTQALLSAYRAMTILELPEAFGHIRLHDPPYKQAERHWTNWKGPVYAPQGPDDAPIAPLDAH